MQKFLYQSILDFAHYFYPNFELHRVYSPEDLKALMYEARELDHQLRDHAYGRIELSKREVEQLFEKLRFVRKRIREHVRQNTIQRETRLEDDYTYRDLVSKRMSQEERAREIRKEQLRYRAHLK